MAQYFNFKCSAYLRNEMVIYYGLVTDLRKPNLISEVNIGSFFKEQNISPEPDTQITLLDVT